MYPGSGHEKVLRVRGRKRNVDEIMRSLQSNPRQTSAERFSSLAVRMVFLDLENFDA
jgi:hypothetical protein